MHHVAAHFRQFKPEAVEISIRLTAGATKYLSMKKYLIQGARPMRPEILARDTFQYGYLCTLTVVSQPVYGIVQVADDHLGFDYRPMWPIWIGHDSFSYSIKNPIGQESDAACFHIFIGV